MAPKRKRTGAVPAHTAAVNCRNKKPKPISQFLNAFRSFIVDYEQRFLLAIL
ncbi:Hypothetical predicted protein [Podarcis lilfordi]|uniref:Uncharacterized protein n=1 Tax=Podarcis lilfordi TaxID=74358 RepID=A0AA35LNH9_9SAUR|nr:Hypothetical predicted protein [Podarcis lilfordi]